MFFSFLCKLKRQNYFNYYVDKISFYALAFSDENLYDFDAIENHFMSDFFNLMKIIDSKKFNFSELEKNFKDIFDIVNRIENIIKNISFEDNRMPLLKELQICKYFFLI